MTMVECFLECHFFELPHGPARQKYSWNLLSSKMKTLASVPRRQQCGNRKKENVESYLAHQSVSLCPFIPDSSNKYLLMDKHLYF